MKGIAITIIGVFCACFVFSQNVNSSCYASDSIRNLYKTDAARFVLRDYYEFGSPHMYSVLIPEDDIEESLDRLIALYNVVGIPAKDTVIDFLNIHTWNDIDVHSFNLSVDTTASYIHNLQDGIIPCGNPTIDSLMDLYEFSICHYSTWSGLTSFHSMKLCTEKYLNVERLIVAFDTISGVFSVSTNGSVCTGSDIEVQNNNNYSIFKFTYGWGDCPAGCIYFRHWYFRVYDDCSVIFGGADGDIMPDYWTGKPTFKSDISIQPNPFNSVIEFSGISGECLYSIYNIYGQEITKGNCCDSKISNLEFLPAGQYIIRISNDSKVFINKIVKI